MKGSPDARVQVKYSCSGFLARYPETFGISECFGVHWSIFPLGPTRYQWQVGTNSLKKYIRFL